MKNDPCWKGYEMVGKKKKGGKEVPNCVPVKEAAKAIIEKAKAKSKKDWTGAKVSKDRFILPEESHDNCGTPDCCGTCDTAVTEARGSDYTLYHKSYTDAINHALSHHEKSGLKVSEDDRFQHVSVGSKKPSEGNTTSLHIPATHSNGKKHVLHVQVFNKGGTHPYELNTYSSGMGRSVKEEAKLEEGYGMWKVEFPKQHVGKPVAAGSVHVKAQNTAHAHKVAAKRVGVDHKVFKSKVTKSSILPEELEDINEMGGDQHYGDTKGAWSAGAKATPVKAKKLTDFALKGLEKELKATRQTSKSVADAKKKYGVKEEIEDIMERGEDSKGHYRATEDGAGLTRKGAKAMGIKTAVTTPPSKLDPKGEAAGRRKSFCARMGGMKGPMKDEKGRPTRKAMSLRRWNCNEAAFDAESKMHDAHYEKQTDQVKNALDNYARRGMTYKQAYNKIRHSNTHTLRNQITAMHEETQLDEVLGKENEWGRPELRKKFAAITPGQEGMTADEIPEMNPFSGDAIHEGGLWDNIHAKRKRIKAGSGERMRKPGSEGAPTDADFNNSRNEETINEISALGAKKRSEFAAKLQKTLADPKKIAKAKKEIAKKKAVQKAEEPKHLVMQLRKATSIGSKVKFYDGSEHHVAPNHVEKFNDRYHSLKSSIEKESLVKRAHKSHADFMRAISEETEMGQPMAPCTCDITPANYPTPSQLSPEPQLGDMNSDGMTNEWDEAAIEAEVTHEIETSDWDELQKYYDSEQEDDDEESESIDEAITPQGRLKKRFAAMRNKTRRNMAKNMALKRIATPDRIKSRSIRAARRMVYKRILRNRDPSSVSPAEKARLEDQVKRMAPMVSRISMRLQQSERKRDMMRVQNARTKKK